MFQPLVEVVDKSVLQAAILALTTTTPNYELPPRLSLHRL
jgi:hypothetical protein